MSRFQDAEQLKLFLSTSTKGNVAATCAKLGISRATFYRTIEWISEQVMAAQHQALASHEDPKRDLKATITANVLAHPIWGCKHHAKELSSGSSISGPTIQSILNQLGFRSRSDRINCLIAKYLAKEVDELTDEQRKAIAEVNPFVADAHFFDDHMQLAFALAGAISICKTSDWKLLIFVELGSSFLFGKLVRSRRDHLGNYGTQSAAKADFERLLQLTKRRDFLVYYHTLTKKHLKPPVTSAKGLDSYRHLDGNCLHSISAIKRRVKRDLIDTPLGTLSSVTIKDLEKTSLRWFAAWNLSQASQDFPTFGRSPAAVLGLSDSQVRSYLKSTLSNDHKPKQR